MTLMRANPLQGPLEGVGPENQDFFGPTPSHGPSNGFAPVKIIRSKCHIKNRYIGNFRAQKSLSFQGPPLPMALDGGKPITKAGEGPENRDNLEINRDMFSEQDTPPVHKTLIPHGSQIMLAEVLQKRNRQLYLKFYI